MTLKSGNPQSCEATKKITKPCHKGSGRGNHKGKGRQSKISLSTVFSLKSRILVSDEVTDLNPPKGVHINID